MDDVAQSLKKEALFELQEHPDDRLWQGLARLDKAIVEDALAHDPQWAYLRTPQQREDENWHSLNAWLGSWE